MPVSNELESDRAIMMVMNLESWIKFWSRNASGRRGALVRLSYASPETITDSEVTRTVTASATVTLAQSLGCGEEPQTSVVTEVRTKSWHRSKPFQRCKHKTHRLVQTLHHKSESVQLWSPTFINPNYADPLFSAVGYNAILAFSS
jgi:hypothetical protein